MDTHTESQLDTSCLLQLLIQVSYNIEDTQARSYCSLCVILMGLGIPKVHEESIPKELSGVTFIACDDLRTDCLVCSYDIPIVFGIKEAGELGRLHQITEHHRQLPSFRFWYMVFAWRRDPQRWLMVLCRRLWGCLSRWRGYVGYPCGVTKPDENAAIFVHC